MPEITVPNWDGSLVTDLPEETTKPGDFKTLTNFVYDKAGFPVTRPGYRPLDPKLAPGIIKYIDPFYTGENGVFLMCYTDPIPGQTSGNVPGLWAWHKQGSFNAVGVAGIDSPAPSLGHPSSAEAGGKWYFTYNAPTDHRLLSFDGRIQSTTSLTDLVGSVQSVPNAPDATRVFYVSNRLWIIPPDALSTIQGSAPDDPTNWTIGTNQSGFLPITQGDGGTVSTIIPFGGQIFVFKDDPNGGSIHQLNEGLTGDGTSLTFQRTTFSNKIGAVSDRAITTIQDRDIVFGSRQGIHSLARVDKFGDLESSFVDFAVANRWRALSLRQKQRAVLLDDWANDRLLLTVDTNNDGINDETWYIHYGRPDVRGFPSFSDADFGFDHGTTFTFGGMLQGAVVVTKRF